MSTTPTINFEHSYHSLGSAFMTEQLPTQVSAPELIAFNWDLARELNLNLPDDPALLANYFSGNTVFASSQPICQAYAGHQFGSFNPRLGDGRAILLGEVIDQNNTRRDIQLKGAGPTPYSRNGDGRAALGPVLREYLISEAMFHLNVPTTRALAAVATGDALWRQGPQPGAVLTRIASSHIRVGTFEYFYRQGMLAEVKTLADYVIARHYPQAQNAENPYVALLNCVIGAQAKLVAHWMHLGFIHGVMNTDNTSVSGETIDYGPCAFMDNFVFHQCFSSIDLEGRYAYSRQPQIALWNLSRFAESLLSLLDNNQDNAIALAEHALGNFQEIYQAYWLNGWRTKLALEAGDDAQDSRFILDYLQCLRLSNLDFTYTNRNLWQGFSGELPGVDMRDKVKLMDWLNLWRERLKTQGLNNETAKDQLLAANPAYIPRNYWVEQAITQARDESDFSLFNDLMELFKNPFVEQAGKEKFYIPPPPHDQPYQTFCGT